MYRLLMFLILLACWMVLSGFFDAFHLTLGVLSCAFVTWISSDLFFEDRNQSLGERFRQVLRLPGYLFWLLREVIASNVHVLRLALTKDGPKRIQPSIIPWKTPLKSDFSKYVLANSITLTPGTVTIRIAGGNVLLVHAISRRTAESLDGTMDRKIAEVFEPEIIDSGKGAAD